MEPLKARLSPAAVKYLIENSIALRRQSARGKKKKRERKWDEGEAVDVTADS